MHVYRLVHRVRLPSVSENVGRKKDVVVILISATWQTQSWGNFPLRSARRWRPTEERPKYRRSTGRRTTSGASLATASRAAWQPRLLRSLRAAWDHMNLLPIKPVNVHGFSAVWTIIYCNSLHCHTVKLLWTSEGLHLAPSVSVLKEMPQTKIPHHKK